MNPSGNPDGKGVQGLMRDWRRAEPRGIARKPERQVLAELFTSLLVLSASFRYRPVPGCLNYLYWMDGRFSLSLIAPQEWSEERRAGFIGTLVLQADMTWTIAPSQQLADSPSLIAAVRDFYDSFSATLDTNRTLEEILPFHVASLPYFQRLYASALSRSLRATLALGNHASKRSSAWRQLLLKQNQEVPLWLNAVTHK